MATVKMKKGIKFADIFDSPETIKQAQKEGWSLVESTKTESNPIQEEKPIEKVEIPKSETVEKSKKNKK